jgi:hypothetical protein
VGASHRLNHNVLHYTRGYAVTGEWGELKKRCAAYHAALTVPASTAALGFVEVPVAPAWPLPTSGIEIELQRPDGARLRIHGEASHLSLTALVRTFLETP